MGATSSSRRMLALDILLTHTNEERSITSSDENTYQKLGVEDDERPVQDESRLYKTLEKVNRPVQCAWDECFAVLGCCGNLRKHVEKQHCQSTQPQDLESTSLSKTYLCRYELCQNRYFHNSHALFEHFLETHFAPLRLRCPISKCRHKTQNLDRLVQHLSVAHNTAIEKLSQSVLAPIPMAKQLKPPAMPDEIMISTGLSMVDPNPRFNSAIAARKMKTLIESGASMLDEYDSESDTPKSPFVRADIPKIMDDQAVRVTPRYQHFTSPSPFNDIQNKDDLPPIGAEEGPTVGYLVWKRRFTEAEKSGKLPVIYHNKRKRRK